MNRSIDPGRDVKNTNPAAFPSVATVSLVFMLDGSTCWWVLIVTTVIQFNDTAILDYLWAYRDVRGEGGKANLLY